MDTKGSRTALPFTSCPTCRVPTVAARAACAYLPRMSEHKEEPAQEPQVTETPPVSPPRPKEIGGPKGPEPTRYGDWQYNGRVTDF